MIIANLGVESVYAKSICFVLAVIKLLCASQNG